MTELKSTLQEIAQNPKLAATVAASTTGTGAGTMLEWIPDDIGKLATLVGICLSVVLVYVHLMTLKKLKLEVAALESAAACRSDSK